MKTIGSIFLLAIMATFYSCISDSYAKELLKDQKPLTSKRIVLTIIAGQSNVGNTRPLWAVCGANTWNVTYQTPTGWNTYMSIEQTRGNYLGFPLYLAQKLQTKQPNDSLFFVICHQGGTSLVYPTGVTWNPLNTDANALFKWLCNQIDLAKAQMPTPDVINFIWVQGEADVTRYTQYLAVETKLFDSLKSRYHVNYFYNYGINQYTSTGALNTTNQKINQQKLLHAASDNSIIATVILPFGNYLPDMQHMTTTGQALFSDSLIAHWR